MTQLRFILPILTLMAALSVSAQSPWERKLKYDLPLLGHRNWIVVADSAYPLQTAPGVETVLADADQLQAVKTVLSELAKTKHVKPRIYIDHELEFVPEKDAPGIDAYRSGLRQVLGEQMPQALPHEKIISRLDEAGKTFRVLLIKTPLTLPYTSVFFELDCGYWNADAESRLREAIKAGEKK